MSMYKVTDTATRRCRFYIGGLDDARNEIRNIMRAEMNSSPRLSVCLMKGREKVWDDSDTITKLMAL